MRTLTRLLGLSLCLAGGCAFMFSSLRERKEPQGKVPCGGHFRTRQSLPDHAQSWLVNKWLWILFVISLYVMLKIRGDGEKSSEPASPSIQACSLRCPSRKPAALAPQKEYAFNTLSQLEMDLVKFMSKVRNLKLVMATGRGLKHHSPEGPTDPNNGITIYEVWGEEDE
ncbi:protein FAM209A [Sorex fumeus]|uniref:protein FAM209A n=1 Tax=Sorex fumeus TaxID=62283 RepID=UPI0024AE65AB|nr:protein FAM209A [Sorex fumeus]